MAHREFKYVAIVPLDCGDPESDAILHYEPGDYIPANVLGRAIGPLVLADKVARMIVNVDDEDGPAVPEQPLPPAASTGSYASGWEGGTVAEEAERERQMAEHEETIAKHEASQDDEDDAEYPQHLGSGLYKLSDGNTIKGKARAQAAEEALA